MTWPVLAEINRKLDLLLEQKDGRKDTGGAKEDGWAELAKAEGTE